MLPLLLALAVFAVHAAETVPLRRTLPTGNWGSIIEGRFAALNGDKYAGIVDGATGATLLQFDAPSPEIRNEKTDGASMYTTVLALSPDRSHALIVVQRKRWSRLTGDRYLKASWELYLVSLAEQKIVRKLADGARQTCDEKWGFTGACPAVLGAAFSPDGGRVLYRTVSDASWYTTPKSGVDAATGHRYGLGHKSTENIFLQETSGKALGVKRFQSVYDETRHTGTHYEPAQAAAGFLADGRAVVAAASAGGCSVTEWDGKRLSFLTECFAPQTVKMRAGAVYSEEQSAIRVWDPLTGALKGKVDGYGSVATALSEQLDTVMRFRTEKSSAVIELQDVASGAVVRRVPFEHPHAGFTPLTLHLNGRDGRALFGTKLPDKDYATLVYEFDAAVPAPVPAPAAPARDFDAPPATGAQTDTDAYAVVIGVEKYRQEGLPPVEYAARDAATMHAYLTKAMGFDPRNVALLTDANASKTDIEKHLGRWLQNRATEKSRVFVYYAGHGSPDPATGEGYLMPYEADPSYLEDTAYPLKRLYASLAKLSTKDVTVVLDACFSGAGGRSLLAKGARPLVTMKAAAVPAGVAALAAASGAQISTSDPERRHGLLTSRVLEALHGGADADGDGAVTGDEVYAFVRPEVERAAKLRNVEQTPMALPSPAALKGRKPWIVLKK